MEQATRHGRKACMKMRPRVPIIGNRFAGIHAAQGLSKLPVDVTLADRRNHHLFQPVLYQVALGVPSPASLAQPIGTVLRSKPNIEVLIRVVTIYALGAGRL